MSKKIIEEKILRESIEYLLSLRRSSLQCVEKLESDFAGEEFTRVRRIWKIELETDPSNDAQLTRLLFDIMEGQNKG